MGLQLQCWKSVDDEKAAYLSVPVRQPELTPVAQINPASGEAMIFLVRGVNFGLAAAVTGYCRKSAFLEVSIPRSGRSKIICRPCGLFLRRLYHRRALFLQRGRVTGSVPRAWEILPRFLAGSPLAVSVTLGDGISASQIASLVYVLHLLRHRQRLLRSPSVGHRPSESQALVERKVDSHPQQSEGRRHHATING